MGVEHDRTTGGAGRVADVRPAAITEAADGPSLRLWYAGFGRESADSIQLGEVEPIPPNRGLILDRNGVPLATNAPSFQLELTREQTPDVDETLAALSDLGLIDSADIPRLRREIRNRRSFDAVPIRLQLTEQDLARFAARRCFSAAARIPDGRLRARRHGVDRRAALSRSVVVLPRTLRDGHDAVRPRQRIHVRLRDSRLPDWPPTMEPP